jgi:hypothetical protein
VEAVIDMKKWIHLRFSFIGIHFWPEAPNVVGWLKLPHRHKFNVQVWIQVDSEVDRELEYFMVLNQIQPLIHKCTLSDQNAGSCEYIATALVEELDVMYDHKRAIKVEIDEDGENGSLVEL